MYGEYKRTPASRQAKGLYGGEEGMSRVNEVFGLKSVSDVSQIYRGERIIPQWQASFPVQDAGNKVG